MKKTSLIVLLTILLYSCSDNFSNNNPYIPNYTFSTTINMNFPQYNDLQYVSNAVYINQTGAGVKGIYVFNTGSGYNAFDAACPNQTLSDCSTLTLNGINLVCPCDKEEYNLFSGQGTLKYPLKQYRVEVNSNIIRVYN
jgi:nitrite reductase/ring-hydroxylating ferredoxin subunit